MRKIKLHLLARRYDHPRILLTPRMIGNVETGHARQHGARRLSELNSQRILQPENPSSHRGRARFPIGC
jgi:hypothetical protein